jgi:hypothetical protein
MKYATKPQNINLAGVVVPPFDYIPYAFDWVTSSLAGILAVKTIDNAAPGTTPSDGRIELIHLIPGTPVRISATGLYPTGVNGTTILDTATITVW